LSGERLDALVGGQVHQRLDEPSVRNSWKRSTQPAWCIRFRRRWVVE
jgi:hypothetical protein